MIENHYGQGRDFGFTLPEENGDEVISSLGDDLACKGSEVNLWSPREFIQEKGRMLV